MYVGLAGKVEVLWWALCFLIIALCLLMWWVVSAPRADVAAQA
jgi:hypothetical protein